MGPVRAAQLVIDGRTIPYAIRESRRARRPSLSIAPATGLVLTIPHAAFAPDQVERFLRRSQRWILRWTERLARAQAAMPKRWPYGDTLLFRGEEHLVRLVAGTPAVIRTADGVLKIRMRRPGIEGAKRLLKRWYIDAATVRLTSRTDELGRAFGIAWNRIRVRDLRRLWGSCSPGGSLSFNYRLIMAPPEVLDYVVIHELMHRQELNHSKRFWSLVARACPDYRNALAWLKTYGAYLTL